jgi:RNA recognition motif-containing protein
MSDPYYQDEIAKPATQGNYTRNEWSFFTLETSGVLEVKLFIGRLPKDFTEDQLSELLGPYGEIRDLTILKDRDGVGKGSKTTLETSEVSNYTRNE